MTKAGKLIRKILMGQNVTYRDAEHVLLNLGFELKISGSHHLFRKKVMQKLYPLRKDIYYCIIKLKLCKEY